MRTVAIIVLIAALASCAPSLLDARLYDLEGGEVLHAQFTYNNTTTGQVSFEGRGDRLEGEYVTVREGTTSWGEIFGLYYSGGTQETALRGSAVAVSVLGTGWLVECEYVTTGAHGHGACRDNRGGSYRLLY